MRHSLTLLQVGSRNISAVMVAFLLTVLSANSAYAAFGDMQTNTPSNHKSIVGNIFGPNPSTSSTTSNSAGTSITNTGKNRVSGVDVPISVKSDYSKGAITAAAIATAALCGSNPLASIVCAAAIDYGVTIGLKKCQDIGWCKSDASDYDDYEYSADIVSPSVWSRAASGACSAGLAKRQLTAVAPYSYAAGSPFINSNKSGCNVDYLRDGAKWGTSNFSMTKRLALTAPPPPTYTPSPPPWQQPGFPPYLDGRQGTNPDFGPSIAGEATGAGNPPASGPISPTVTAAPASGQPTVKTESIPKSDGSTDTKTTSTTTTVTPTVNNNNTQNTNIIYETKTTTTTNVTNSATNITTSNTTTETKPDTKPDATPDDGKPRECGSTGKPKCLIDETGTPDASTFDKDQDLAKIDAKNNEMTTAVGQISATSVGLFNWFPQIQTASCVNPEVPNPITHAMLSVEICKPVDIFSKFITAVLCFFALVGSVRNVQEAMRA